MRSNLGEHTGSVSLQINIEEFTLELEHKEREITCFDPAVDYKNTETEYTRLIVDDGHAVECNGTAYTFHLLI